MNRFLTTAVLGSTYLLPVFALAATGQGDDADLGNLQTLLEAIGNLVSIATPIVVGLALLVFFWGLVKYIFAASDDDKGAGKRLMIGGIIAIFVMVAIVGIVKFIANAFDVGTGGSLPVPSVDTTG